MAEEQVVLDEHEHKVEELMECLEMLVHVAMTKPVIPPAPGMGNYRPVATVITLFCRGNIFGQHSSKNLLLKYYSGKIFLH